MVFRPLAVDSEHNSLVLEGRQTTVAAMQRTEHLNTYDHEATWRVLVSTREIPCKTLGGASSGEYHQCAR